jgi:hypothetical protein
MLKPILNKDINKKFRSDQKNCDYRIDSANAIYEMEVCVFEIKKNIFLAFYSN